MSDSNARSPGIDLTKGIPVPKHPPPQGPEREQWKGWEAWDQHCRLVQQHTHIRDILQYVTPMLDYYYNLDNKHLGSITLPIIEFPEQPDLEEYSYDAVERWLKDFYEKTFELALLRSHHHQTNQHHTQEASSLPLYHPLQLPRQSSSIRLLEVLPSATQDGSLSARLFNVDLGSTCPLYEALSYRWEEKSEDSKEHFVIVNGFRKIVTSNLHSALSSLRHRARSRILWVDSICINQADDTEKYHQVLLMAKIYGNASRVVVYLGPSTTASATLFEMLQLPTCSLTTIGGLQDEDESDNEHNHKDEKQTSNDLAFWNICHNTGPELVEGFIDVSTRSWWSRVWIIQEYTLNKRDPVIYCGRSKVTNAVFAKNFTRLFSWVEHRRRHLEPLENCDHPACDKSFRTAMANREVSAAGENKENEDEASGHDAFSPQVNPNSRRSILPPQGSTGRQWTAWGRQIWKAHLVMMRREHCSPFSMSYYLTLGLQSECTNPCDIVYGLRELMDPLFQGLFPPDYTIPLPTLFTRLAAYMIIVEKNMDMFWHFPYRLRDDDAEKPQLQTQKGTHGVPSWVPNFSRPRLNRDGDQIPNPCKEKTGFWPEAAHILDYVLFMDGLLLDEITNVFSLAQNDYFLILYGLWWVERSFWEPQYLQDDKSEIDHKITEAKDKTNEKRDLHKCVTIYPSIEWATDTENSSSTSTSIVDLIYELTDLRPTVTEIFESYLDKIPQVVDLILKEDQRTSTSHDDADTSEKGEGLNHLVQDIQDIDLSERTFPTPILSRDDLVGEMELRFMEFSLHITAPNKLRDLTGISTFDYDNFCSQILEGYRLIWSRCISDLSGDKQGQEATDMTFSRHAISYSEYIDAVDNGNHLLEIRLREGFVVDLATAIHNKTADMVGVQGDKVRGRVEVEGVQQKSGSTKEVSRRRIYKLRNVADNRKTQQDHQRGDTSRDEISSLGLPHNVWSIEVRELMYDVHHSLCDVVDFLAGRELFITEAGLVGITGVGISGIQDGDDLLLLEGMSYPLIGRLEPSTELGSPKKRRREMSTKMMKREVLGTAIVKDVDPKDGNVDEAIVPHWFEDLSQGKRGLFRFS